MRFFRSDESTYESARLAIDAAFGHEPPETSISPASCAPRDAGGRIVLAVPDEFFEQSAAVLLPLLANGAVEEITEAEYQAAVQLPPGAAFREAAGM